jgi:HK97 family phage portal protein
VSVLFGNRAETRTITWDDFFGPSGGPGRKTIRGDHALRVIPVYSAVSLIADSISTLPVQAYRGEGDTREQIAKTGFLLDPHTGLTWVDWVHQLMVSLLLRGNAYGVVTWRGPWAESIRWIHPDSVTVDESGSAPTYSWHGGEPQLDIAHGGNFLHVRAFAIPGKWKAPSPIELFASQLETWDSASSYGKEWFDNSGVPTGILKNDLATLDRIQSDIARQSFVDATKRPGPVTLDKNWTWTKVSVTPQEAQFLETIKAGATQIASIFRVDPTDIGGEAGNQLTYSTREQNQIRFNVRTLLPWTVRLEHVFKPLLPPGEFIKFNLDGLARPDLLTRIRANNEALKGGQATLAEVRRQEDRRPLSADEIAFWQEMYATFKSESESSSTSTSQVKE